MDEVTPYDYLDRRYQSFNQSLDEDGKVFIAESEFSPSSILFEMDPIGYVDAYTVFKEEEFERLKESIYKYYPSSIAYHFRLSEKGEGASDPVRKLLHLKDTWESIVFVLHALLWGEIRHKEIDLKVAEVYVSEGANGNPVFQHFKTGRLLSDALKTKIYSVKAVVEFSKANNLELKCEAITTELLDKLLALQNIRNDISHHATPTKEEAEAELLSVSPLFKEMLSLTGFLSNCRLLRFESFATTCKCEEYNGHALNKEFDDFAFDAAQNYVLALGQEQIFVKWEEDVFSLSPFLHYTKDQVGRESYLSVYKRKRDGRYWFEPTTLRDEVCFDQLQTRFDAEQATLVSLLVP